MSRFPPIPADHREEVVRKTAGSVDLTEARIIVSGGRGVEKCGGI